jgi:succinyl-CoA synthetase beta subunit
MTIRDQRLTIVYLALDLGFGKELANYGEYSGAPSTEHTFEYAKTIISLMTRERDERGKILLIGGGIANFTDVAATFTGLIKAIESFRDDLKTNHVSTTGTLSMLVDLLLMNYPLIWHR